MPNYLFVDQPDSLKDTLSNFQRLGVDTEFMREKTYFAQLCLVQIAAGEALYCVDPLADAGRDAFWEQLLATDWVAHSARQDIEVVFQTSGKMPASLFDTQIAAGLLGMPAQVGYAGLVKELFDVEMAKSHTRADWTRRPLQTAELDYAAEDVEYLLPAADILSERLDKKDRLDWVRQDSALLLEESLYEVSAEQAIERLKGARNFRGPKRAAAVRLAVWREEEAIRRNRPRQWIVRDKLLLDIAYKLPSRISELAAIDGMPPKLLQRNGRKMLQEIQAASEEKNHYEPPRPPDEEQKALLKEMQSRVAECADELDLATETLASKRELSAVIISGNRDSRVFGGWRKSLIGDVLAEML